MDINTYILWLYFDYYSLTQSRYPINTIQYIVLLNCGNTTYSWDNSQRTTCDILGAKTTDTSKNYKSLQRMLMHTWNFITSWFFDVLNLLCFSHWFLGIFNLLLGIHLYVSHSHLPSKESQLAWETSFLPLPILTFWI